MSGCHGNIGFAHGDGSRRNSAADEQIGEAAREAREFAQKYGLFGEQLQDAINMCVYRTMQSEQKARDAEEKRKQEARETQHGFLTKPKLTRGRLSTRYFGFLYPGANTKVAVEEQELKKSDRHKQEQREVSESAVNQGDQSVQVFVEEKKRDEVAVCVDKPPAVDANSAVDGAPALDSHSIAVDGAPAVDANSAADGAQALDPHSIAYPSDFLTKMAYECDTMGTFWDKNKGVCEGDGEPPKQWLKDFCAEIDDNRMDYLNDEETMVGIFWLISSAQDSRSGGSTRESNIVECLSQLRPRIQRELANKERDRHAEQAPKFEEKFKRDYAQRVCAINKQVQKKLMTWKRREKRTTRQRIGVFFKNIWIFLTMPFAEGYKQTMEHKEYLNTKSRTSKCSNFISCCIFAPCAFADNALWIYSPALTWSLYFKDIHGWLEIWMSLLSYMFVVINDYYFFHPASYFDFNDDTEEQYIDYQRRMFQITVSTFGPKPSLHKESVIKICERMQRSFQMKDLSESYRWVIFKSGHSDGWNFLFKILASLLGFALVYAAGLPFLPGIQLLLFGAVPFSYMCYHLFRMVNEFQVQALCLQALSAMTSSKTARGFENSKQTLGDTFFTLDNPTNIEGFTIMREVIKTRAVSKKSKDVLTTTALIAFVLSVSIIVTSYGRSWVKLAEHESPSSARNDAENSVFAFLQGTRYDNYLIMAVFLVFVLTPIVLRALWKIKTSNKILSQGHLQIIISELKKLNKMREANLDDEGKHSKHLYKKAVLEATVLEFTSLSLPIEVLGFTANTLMLGFFQILTIVLTAAGYRLFVLVSASLK